MTLGLRLFIVRLHYVWNQHYNYVSFFPVILPYFLLRHNYVTDFFYIVTIFDDVRIPLYFGIFELRMEMML